MNATNVQNSELVPVILHNHTDWLSTLKMSFCMQYFYLVVINYDAT